MCWVRFVYWSELGSDLREALGRLGIIDWCNLAWLRQRLVHLLDHAFLLVCVALLNEVVEFCSPAMVAKTGLDLLDKRWELDNFGRARSAQDMSLFSCIGLSTLSPWFNLLSTRLLDLGWWLQDECIVIYVDTLGRLDVQYLFAIVVLVLLVVVTLCVTLVTLTSLCLHKSVEMPLVEGQVSCLIQLIQIDLVLWSTWGYQQVRWRSLVVSQTHFVRSIGQMGTRNMFFLQVTTTVWCLTVYWVVYRGQGCISLEHAL